MQDEVMTIGEAAEFLKSSKTHVFTLIREGELPVTRRGKRYTQLMKSDLLAFLERHRKEAGPAKEVQQ